MSEYAGTNVVDPAEHITDGMQLAEFIGEVSSLYVEGAVKSDDVKFVTPEGIVYVPDNVVYDTADDSVVIQMIPFVEV